MKSAMPDGSVVAMHRSKFKDFPPGMRRGPDSCIIHLGDEGHLPTNAELGMAERTCKAIELPPTPELSQSSTGPVGDGTEHGMAQPAREAPGAAGQLGYDRWWWRRRARQRGFQGCRLGAQRVGGLLQRCCVFCVANDACATSPKLQPAICAGEQQCQHCALHCSREP